MHTLSARRAIVLTCWGMRVGAFPYASTWTLGLRLQRMPELQAMITTLRATIVDQLDLALGYFLANRGWSFGAVCAALNRLRVSREQQAEYLCFGDSRSYLPGALPSVKAVERAEGFAVSLPAGDGRIDLAVELPRAPGPAVCLFDGPGDLETAVYDNQQTVYLSLGATPEISTATLRLIGAPQLQRLADDFAAQALGLQGLQAVVRAYEPQEATKELVHQMSGAIRKVWAARLPNLVPGSVVPVQPCQDEADEIYCSLDSIGAQVATVFATASEKHGSMDWMTKVATTFRSSYVPSDQRCPYCHGEVVRLALRSAAHGTTLWQHSCDNCGVILQGHDEWLSLLGSPLFDDQLTVEIELRNPTEIALPAHVSALVRRFEHAPGLGQSAVDRLGPLCLPAGGRATVRLSLSRPASMPRGVHCLGVLVLVGANSTFLTRQVVAR